MDSVEGFLESALRQCGNLRASLCSKATSEDELMATATAFVLEAKRIYEELGGPEHVAAQFYHLADSALKEQAKGE